MFHWPSAHSETALHDTFDTLSLECQKCHEAAKTKGKPTHPHNSEKAGIEEEDDEYAGPSSLQYDVFHDGGMGE